MTFRYQVDAYSACTIYTHSGKLRPVNWVEVSMVLWLALLLLAYNPYEPA